MNTDNARRTGIALSLSVMAAMATACTVATDTNPEEAEQTENAPNQAGAALVAGKKPNFLIIMMDDLNDWVSPLGGNSQAITPNIQTLANRGLVFNHAYTASPICNASRTAMWTGKRP